MLYDQDLNEIYMVCEHWGIADLKCAVVTSSPCSTLEDRNWLADVTILYSARTACSRVQETYQYAPQNVRIV